MKKSKLILMAVTSCLCIAMLGFATYADEQAPITGVLPEGITLHGESLAGLTVEEAKEAVAAYADAALNRTINLKLADSSYEIPMDAISMAWKNENVADQLDEMELKGNVISRYKKMKDVEKNPVDLAVEMQYDQEALGTLIAGYVEECTLEREEPSLTRVNGEFVINNGRNGVSFDLEKIQKDVEKLLKDESVDNIEYTAEAKVDEPEQGVDVYAGFKGDVLGSYTTVYRSSEANRSSNIRLAAAKITGHSYLPGEEFSILSLIDPVTKEGGYLEAGTYENGKVVQGIGGGICQMATTVYDAALRAEMEITERRNHSMVASYVPFAWDAMIYAQDGKDFKFINNTDYPIYIEVGVQEGVVNEKDGDSILSVYIYGTETRPANRTIEFRSVTKNMKWPDAFNMKMYEVIVDQNLPIRETKEISAAHPYVVAECWKDIYVDGVLQESVFINESKYEPGTGVMSIGTDIAFDSWSKPGADGWPEIYQSINYISSLKQQEEESRRAEEESRRAEEESRKAEEESKRAELEAEEQPSAPAPEESGEDLVDGQ